MSEGRLTYGDYLAVPQLLALQHPLSEPPVHGEMLFIVVQQAQELWFKQLLHELHLIVRRLTSGALEEAAHVLDRVNRILGMLAEGVEILEALPPSEFQNFGRCSKPPAVSNLSNSVSWKSRRASRTETTSAWRGASPMYLLFVVAGPSLCEMPFSLVSVPSPPIPSRLSDRK